MHKQRREQHNKQWDWSTKNSWILKISHQIKATSTTIACWLSSEKDTTVETNTKFSSLTALELQQCRARAEHMKTMLMNIETDICQCPEENEWGCWLESACRDGSWHARKSSACQSYGNCWIRDEYWWSTIYCNKFTNNAYSFPQRMSQMVIGMSLDTCIMLFNQKGQNLLRISK